MIDNTSNPPPPLFVLIDIGSLEYLENIDEAKENRIESYASAGCNSQPKISEAGRTTDIPVEY